MANDPQNVEDILDRLDELAGQRDRASVGDVVESFGRRSFGPFLMVPALIELSPIGGIPGVPTFLALIILLFAGQMVLGRHHFWLPQVVSRRSVSGPHLEKAARKLRPTARFLDRWFHGRIERLTTHRAARWAAGICVLLTLTVPPLELIPFASSAPMGAIALFGLALLVRDGALMIAAGVLSLVAVGTGIYVLVGG